MLPTWKLNLLKNIDIDLFINQASFQEMEKYQSLHYLNFFKENTKYIFTKNAINGHLKAKGKGKFGVINPTRMVSRKRFRQKNHKIISKEIFNYHKNYRLLFKSFT